MLKEGTEARKEIIVTKENTAKVMGSGELEVFARLTLSTIIPRRSRKRLNFLGPATSPAKRCLNATSVLKKA